MSKMNSSRTVSLREVAATLDALLDEMVRAERLVHGPACEGGKEIRKLLVFYRDQVLSRLARGKETP